MPFAHSSFRSSMSTAMIVRAPASRAPAIAASPTPPQPKTATVSPRPTPPVLIAAPTPAITPQPSRPAAVGGAAGSTLVHCPEWTSVFSAKAPMPSAGESSVPSASVIFCVALWVAKQYQGLPLSAGAALPAHRPPVQDHVVADRHVGDALADRRDQAGGLVAEQERELVVDPALAVVQVGVADPAGLHVDDRLARTRIGHEDRLDADRCTLAAGDDALHLVRPCREPRHPVLAGTRIQASGRRRECRSRRRLDPDSTQRDPVRAS